MNRIDLGKITEDDICFYSRKSKFTGKGDSTVNQIEMGREYCMRNFGVGIRDENIFEDEGYSGGNTNRPDFQRMMEKIENKEYKIMVCYRLDRISRNIRDFAEIIDMLDSHGVAFISIRESFDTTTPMGRAMMYIASVFAQLERETIAERVRDNMQELAKTGRWLGGVPPLGFDSERVSYIDSEYKERSLVVLKPIRKEMKTVDFFYDKYIELGSIHKVRKFLIQNNFKTRNDAYFHARVLSDILRNPAYVKADERVVNYLESKGIEIAGKENIDEKKAILIYNKTDNKGIQNEFEEWIGAVAKHKGYIEPDKWLRVQQMLDRNSMTLPRTGTSDVALLSGILRCAECDSPMNVTYGRKRKDGTAPHYYVCRMKTISGKDKCQNENVNGKDIEHTVVEKLIKMSKSKSVLKELEQLRNKKIDSYSVNTLDELKAKRKAILEEINNLVGEVSKSAAAAKYILPQIEARDEEVKKLDEQIAKLEKDGAKSKKKTESFDLVINNIFNFANVVDGLSNREKKNFLQTIVDKVYWDGDSGEVAIKLLTDTSVSQYHTGAHWERYGTGIILYETINTTHKYEDMPEDTLGGKIRKLRFMNELTAEELGDLCGCTKHAIYRYESNEAKPSECIISKICAVLNICVEYFKDDYYSFVLSENYTDFLKKWRQDNTKKATDIDKVLGVSFRAYWMWENGIKMKRRTFERIREKLGL